MEVDSPAPPQSESAAAPVAASSAGSSTLNGTGEPGGPSNGDTEMAYTGPAHPEGASEVIYINGLNEKIKLDGQPPLGTHAHLCALSLTLSTHIQ